MELPEIYDKLETIPSLKARKCEETTQKKFEFENERLNLKREEAVKRLAFRRTYTEDTVGDCEARLQQDPDLTARRLAVLRLENQYESLEYQIQSLTDQLNAVKLIARLRMAEMGAGISDGRD